MSAHLQLDPRDEAGTARLILGTVTQEVSVPPRGRYGGYPQRFAARRRLPTASRSAVRDGKCRPLSGVCPSTVVVSVTSVDAAQVPTSRQAAITSHLPVIPPSLHAQCVVQPLGQVGLIRAADHSRHFLTLVKYDQRRNRLDPEFLRVCEATSTSTLATTARPS